MLNLNRIHHVSLICTDYVKSKSFYVDILGLSIVAETFRTERQSHKLDLALNGIYVLELFSFPDVPARLSFPEATGLRHLAFEVDDLCVATDLLSTRNVTSEPIRVDEITGKRFTFIRDPDDLPIELYEK